MKAEYRQQKPESRRLFVEARRYIPGGVSTNLRYFLPFPIFFKGARGATITDVDGTDYIDYNLSYGALLLGHNHPYVVRTAKKYMERYGTTNFGAPTELEIVMAKRIRSIIPSAEKIRFSSTGTEAVMHSIRIARGFMKKPLLAKFEGHFHGTYDDVLVSTTSGPREGGTRRNPRPVSSSRGIPRAIYRNTIVLPFNDLESASRIIRKNRKRLACVIMEPVSKGYVPGSSQKSSAYS
jgi:glutamate-1-semialdehyde 2,1-aminomutase